MTKNEIINSGQSGGGMFAVIPAVVMHDAELPMSAKMLYGIITWKCNDRSYCWASNKTLAELLQLSAKRVSALISILEEAGHVETEIIKDEVTGQILRRKIYPIVKSSRGLYPDEPDNTPYPYFEGEGIPKNEDTPPHFRGEGIPKNEEEKYKEEIKKENIYSCAIFDEAVRAIRKIVAADDAAVIRDSIFNALEEQGFACQHEAPVNARSSDPQYTGRISILAAKQGITIAIEVDRKTPKKNSVFKLQSFECDFRLIVCRGGTSEKTPEGIDAVIQLEANEENDLFQQFWDEYPKKVNKQKARKAFESLHVTVRMLETMLQAIRIQKISRQWKEDDGRYIPHASTWLNGHRWEDEVRHIPPNMTSARVLRPEVEEW